MRTLTRARAQQPSIELALILGMRIITVCQTVLSGNLYGQFPDSHSGNQSGLTAFPRGLRKWIQCPGGWNQGPGGFGIRAREAGMRARVIGFRAREGPHGVEAGPRGSPKTEFCKITPPVRSGGPQRAPQHKILQNYAPREGPRASKGPPNTKFHKITFYA